MARNKMKKQLFKRSKKDKMKCKPSCSCGGGVYFLGFIGSVVYYIQNAASFFDGVLGVLKAIVWPAMLVYKLLG
jgi:hypothetical protein